MGLSVTFPSIAENHREYYGDVTLAYLPYIVDGSQVTSLGKK